MFKITVYLPCSKIHVNLRQFNNFEYKTLLKMFANKNYKETNDHINTLLQNCVDIKITHLNFIDKLILLLNLRCVSISDIIVQTIKLETSTAKINYSVYTLIDKLVNFNYPNLNNLYIKKDNIEIKLTTPTNLFIDTTDVSNFIGTVNIKNKSYCIEELTYPIRVEFIDNLPGVILTELYEHIYNFKEILGKLEIMQLRTDIDKKEMHSIYLHIDQTHMFQFVNVLFNEHLSNLFLKQFILSKHHNIDCEYYDKMIPIESEIFYNFHKEIQEEENKSTNPNGATNRGPVIPGAIVDSI